MKTEFKVWVTITIEKITTNNAGESFYLDITDLSKIDCDLPIEAASRSTLKRAFDTASELKDMVDAQVGDCG